jgi:oligoribonuclease NrnB/cAMP/cGMP phosphodiesterase (DHH superfamily)
MKHIKLFEQFINEAKVLQQGGDSFKKGQTVNFRLNSEVISGIIKAISLNKKDPKSSKITIQHKGDKGVTSKNSWKTVEIYTDQLIVSDKYGDWIIS